MGVINEAADDSSILVMKEPWDLWSALSDLTKGSEEGPLYLMDVGEVVRTLSRWTQLLPRVKPFYAVKCNPDKYLLSTLVALGTGFDCASIGEIDLVTALGVKPDRIIFASPAKLPSHVRRAARLGVHTSTFDSVCELTKMKELCPQAKLLLRIRCDANDAHYRLGVKFGCDPLTEAPELLRRASQMQLEVIGIAFHIGSGGRDFKAYERAIQLSQTLFVIGAREGHSMRLLDIGGGFPSSRESADLELIADIINNSLTKYFPDENVEVIAEPGRYLACTPFVLAAVVHSKREKTVKDADGTPGKHTMYFISDGVYGSFNCVLTDERVTTETLKACSKELEPSSVWGPTGDATDCVIPSVMLPPLAVGDWLVFRDMGAYSLAIATCFNGFPKPRVKAVVDATLCPVLSKLQPLSEMQFIAHTTATDSYNGQTFDLIPKDI